MKFSARTLFWEVVAVLVFAIVAATATLVWRLSQGPLDLVFLMPQVEAALTDARGGRPVTIEGLALEWSDDRRRVEAAARGLTAFDETGAVAARADRAVIAVETASLLRGRIKTIGLRLEKGSATLSRQSSGVWTLSAISEPREAAPTPPRFDISNWRALLPPVRAAIAEQSFRRVELIDFDLSLEDAANDVSWRAYPLNGEWAADESGVSLSVQAALEGGGAPERASLSAIADPDVSSLSLSLAAEDVSLRQLADLFALEAPPAEYDGDADIAVSVAASEARGLEGVELAVSAGEGVFRYGALERPVQRAELDAQLDLVGRRLRVLEFDVEAQGLSGVYSLDVDLEHRFEGASAPDYPLIFSARDAVLDAQPMFEGDWTFDAVDLSGQLNIADRTFDLERVIANVGEFSAVGSGQLYLGDVDGSSLVGARVEAVAENASVDDVLRYWPVRLGAGARNWVAENVLGGRAVSAVFTMDFPPGANRGAFLEDDVLNLEFEVEDAEVRILSDLPNVSKAAGRGVLGGNSLSISLEDGRFGEWIIDDGEVEIAKFAPGNNDLVVDATGRGDLKTLLEVLDASRLNVAERYGLDLDRVSGPGGLDVKITRPTGPGTTLGDVDLSVKGGFVDAVVPELAAGFGLDRTDLDIDVTQNGMTLRGAGRFGPAPMEFTWTEVFDAGPLASSTLEAAGVATPDLLNAFGIAARSFMQGEAEIELSATGKGREFESFTANLDFTKSALDLSEFGWRKAYDAAATGAFRYGRDASGAAVATGDIRAEGLELTGEAVFAAGGEFQRAAIERIFADGQVDLRGDLLRGDDGALKINVSGPYFNASPWIDGLLNLGGDGSAGAAGVDAELSVAVDDMKLRDDASLSNARLVMEVVDGDVDKALIAGTTGPRSGLEGTLETDGDIKIVNLRADDAGFVIRSLFKADYLIGGRMVLDGQFGEESGSAQLRITDVRVRDAPLVAQVFSLASLRGLSDVLSGDGVLFSEVDAPLQLSDGRIDLPGVRASGPALGLTSRGWVNTDAGELNLDGVVVPSFGVNSALGGLPIIGDLFVSRQGEGVFAVTYSVRGTLERARVGINPLSAVAPGVLRRIFENPDTPPPLPEDDDSETPAVDREG